MSHPDKIYPIDFAGFFDLKDEPYYEGKSLLNIEDYPAAKEFADEVCRRWNIYNDLLKALEDLYSFAPDGPYPVDGSKFDTGLFNAALEAQEIIKKARL